MRIGVAGDHAGLELKDAVVGWLKQSAHEVIDLGPHEYDPDDDYPDYALKLAEAVASGRVQRGVLVCGSGVGASVAANKVPGVRAAICHDGYTAHQGVEHDDMNVLCLGGRVIGPEVARELVAAFVGAEFSAEERHVRRLNKVLAIEQRNLKGRAQTAR
ncbi:MAG: ribose-5-phosphate isomerase [Dehalococcoidia bacterium]